MALGAGRTLTYNVPAVLLTIRGLDYYFELTSGPVTVNAGSADQPFQFVVQLTNAEAQSPTATPSLQYRMIGLPIEIAPATNRVSDVFPDDLGDEDRTQWRLGSFISHSETVDEFPNAARVVPGRGYWLITRARSRFGSAGTSVLPSPDRQRHALLRCAAGVGMESIREPVRVRRLVPGCSD